ncbi:MAG TPA: MFS transporter [Acidimicrobiales bacterium]|nr:MFS transporter [Acidimicrobiales bacterium]
MRRRVGSAIRTTFRSLRVRNFRLFFVGQLISQVGTWLTQIALVLLVLHRTKSGVAIGALVACQFGPMLLLGAYGGVVADRADKRRLLLTTQTLQMLQSFSLGALAFVHGAPLPAFYAAALAGGLFLAFDNPARRSFVAEMVPLDEVHNAVTLNSALMTSSRIFGPALAGVLVVSFGYGWAFTLDAISYLAVLAGLWMMRTEELFVAPPSRRGRGQVREGLRYVRSVPALWVPLAMVALVGTLTFNFSVVLPLFVERTLGGTDTSYTLLYSVLSVGSLIGALMTAHRRSVEVRHVVVASFAFGVAMLVFAAMPNLLAAFPIALAVGLTSIAFMTACTAIVQVRAAPNMRGRVLALQAMVMIGSTPIGGPVLGAVCDAFGARVGLVIGGAAALVAAGWGHAMQRTRDVAMTTADSVDDAVAEAVGVTPG